MTNKNIEQSNSITKKLIFNPHGTDEVIHRRIIKGNTTNLFNLNETKYTWAKSLYRVMLANFWIPEKVDLTQDIQDYKKLTPAEVKAYDSILSFLTFLDSIQTNNLPNVANYITAPEVGTLIAIQGYQEVIHSQSYAYILESTIPSNKRNKVYETWRTDKILFERNKYIANIYQKFVDNPSDDNFAEMLIANYILESLYFYNGFIFFYSLASRNLMLGVADEIRYINRDEKTHIDLFAKIFLAINLENKNFIKQETVHRMFEIATKQEMDWANHILGNEVMGIKEESIEKYTKYLANARIKNIGFEPLFPGFDKSPYAHLEKLSDVKGDDIKSNFFESTVTSYSQANALPGWEELRVMDQKESQHDE